jgi:putative SOS response-associated peptidase YedK
VCGRYTVTRGPAELARHFEVPIAGDAGTRRFNVAPTQEALAIVSSDQGLEARLLRWGLLTPWAKTANSGYKLINARLETVAVKPLFSRMIANASGRALLVADGYFEWLKPERRGALRQPFYFQVDDGVPFAFAALWTTTKVDSVPIDSATVITCDSAANGVAAAIHGRMPVILADRSAQLAWLDPAVDCVDALALCAVLPVARLSGRAANPAVNHAAAEGPELLTAPPSQTDEHE